MADGYFKSISVKDIIGFSQWKTQWIHVKAELDSPNFSGSGIYSDRLLLTVNNIQYGSVMKLNTGDNCSLGGTRIPFPQTYRSSDPSGFPATADHRIREGRWRCDRPQ